MISDGAERSLPGCCRLQVGLWWAAGPSATVEASNSREPKSQVGVGWRGQGPVRADSQRFDYSHRNCCLVTRRTVPAFRKYRRGSPAGQEGVARFAREAASRGRDDGRWRNRITCPGMHARNILLRGKPPGLVDTFAIRSPFGPCTKIFQLPIPAPAGFWPEASVGICSPAISPPSRNWRLLPGCGST